MTTPLLLPPGQFSAYLFDLDGTIANSMPLHYVAWVKAMEECGGTFPEDLFYSWGGVPPVKVVEQLNEKYGLAMAPEAIVERKESLYLSMLGQLQPILSVVAHIEARSGETPFAIVSGSPRASIFKTLETLNLLQHFPVIVGSEDYIHGKPSPEPFLTAARLLNVPPTECLVFEDAEAGFASAIAAGMQYVRVPVVRAQAHVAL